MEMWATEWFMKYQIQQLEEENKNLNKKIDKLIQKIDKLEEENENLRKDLFHLTNNGKAK